MHKLLTLRNFFIVAILVAAGGIGYAIWTHEPPITSGIVYNKEFQVHREWTEIVEDCYQMSVGSNVTIPICSDREVNRSSPDMWMIDIEGATESGKMKTRRVQVGQDLYNSTHIGEDFYVPNE